ncbi:hypothetical protein BJF78_32575 [Pseudonocardia sp. CNS-139]|nr:hypothetical protein BJF78_32575 [Pseudonocardia sp. CNS-139]
MLADLQRIGAEDPSAVQLLLKAIKDGTQPGRIGDDQADRLVAAVTEHADVRWTVLLMHMPMWQGAGHPALDRLRAALGDRPYTAFAGHAHNYRHSRIDGRDHVRLGSTGGIRSGEGEGSFDHVAWVTMTPAGPLVANLLLDGVLDVTGAAPTDGIA